MPKREPLDLNEIVNPECRHCKNQKERSTSEGLCETVTSVEDDLPIRCVGKWAFDKIYFLNQYFGIFGNGMKFKWDGRIDYIEICSGPGRCVLREDAREVNGTSLTVVNNKFFKHYHSATFFDISEPVVNTLNQRLGHRNLLGQAKAAVADYNRPSALADAARQRSAGGLNLVFIDPTDCGIPFETIRALKAALVKVDFIISMMTLVDANRHLARAVLEPDSNVRAKYARFLGSSAFFTDPQNRTWAEARDARHLRDAFRDAYKDSMRTLGYTLFAMEPIDHYYELLFATSHDRGLEFWREAQRVKPDNQATLDLGI